MSIDALGETSQQIGVDGLQIGFRMEGSGPPVVLLHGFFGDHRVWRRQFELADHYTVVAWDAPGCGVSSSPQPTFQMAEYADLLAAFIRALGLVQPNLVGNSFGGTLALEVAIRHPELARSVVVVDGYAGWSGSFSPEVVAQRLAGCLPDLQLPADQVAEKWLPGFVTASAVQAVKDDLSSIIVDFRPDGMRPMIRALAEADLRAGLPRVDIPTLLIWGGQDVRSPLFVAEDLQAQIAGSRLVVIDGVGHLSQAEAPERFNDELRRFLESLA
jgi:pimeloyl-ACP methyl ester carboxylesterase